MATDSIVKATRPRTSFGSGMLSMVSWLIHIRL